MRNPVGISSLVEVTQICLKEQQTIYRYPKQDGATKYSTDMNKKSAALVLSGSDSNSKGAIKIKPSETIINIASQVKHEKQQSKLDLVMLIQPPPMLPLRNLLINLPTNQEPILQKQ